VGFSISSPAGGAVEAALRAARSLRKKYWRGHGEAGKQAPMIQLLLIIHILLAVALVIVVLLQRSEGGALGIGGGGGGMMTGRAQANLLTRATATLAALFMLNCLVLAVLAGADRRPRSILDEPAGQPSTTVPAAPAPVEPPVAPAAPATPTPPTAPIAPPTQ
jgi:preprotein translocase subunit SecG